LSSALPFERFDYGRIGDPSLQRIDIRSRTEAPVPSLPRPCSLCGAEQCIEPIGARIIAERIAGFYSKAEILLALRLESLEYRAARFVLIAGLLVLGVVLVAAPPDQISGDYPRVGFDDYPVRITLLELRDRDAGSYQARSALKNIKPTGTPKSFCGLIDPATSSTARRCSLSPSGRLAR
jgi:hypothetical protein